MAAKWQQWMPLNINKIRGSMFFMALPDAAKVGYLFLLLAQWETDDGALPGDQQELAVLSGLGDRWEEFGPRIMRKFDAIEGGKVRNQVNYDDWLEAKKVFEGRQKGADRTNQERSAHAQRTLSARSAHAQRTLSDDPAIRSADTLTETLTEEQKQKPSRRSTASGEPKHSSDPRHVACKERIFAAYRHMNSGANPDWDGREGRALGMLLRAQPELNEESINPLLAHWARSDINHSDRPSIWIPKLSSFRMSPVDRFGKPKEGLGGKDQRSGSTASPTVQRINAARTTLAEAARERGILNFDCGIGANGSPLSQPRLEPDTEGIPGGLRATGPEILPPERA